MAAPNVTDTFQGAEADIDKQRMSALMVLAQFGRRGAEAAAAAAVQRRGVTGANGADAHAYLQDANQRSITNVNENEVLKGVAKNFYRQVSQAVPLARTAAAKVVDEYRAAYMERQAAAALAKRVQEAQLAQAAASLQLQRDAMAQQAAQFGAQQAGSAETIAALGGGGGGSTGGGGGYRPGQPGTVFSTGTLTLPPLALPTFAPQPGSPASRPPTAYVSTARGRTAASRNR